MSFPELTICNLNIFKSSQLQAVMTPEQFQMINSNVDGDQFGNIFNGNYNNGGNSSPIPMATPETQSVLLLFGILINI